ncbi:hypothetical protein PAJ34TS1_09700 [Paenibacillus azoreducens]
MVLPFAFSRGGLFIIGASWIKKVLLKIVPFLFFEALAWLDVQVYYCLIIKLLGMI